MTDEEEEVTEDDHNEEDYSDDTCDINKISATIKFIGKITSLALNNIRRLGFHSSIKISSNIFLTSPSETARQQLTTIVLLLLLLLLLRTSNGLVHTSTALLSLVNTHRVHYTHMYQEATNKAVCLTVHMCHAVSLSTLSKRNLVKAGGKPLIT